jgi:GT2 family glycosyltransferase
VSVSIGIPVRNNLNYPKQLLYSLKKYTVADLIDSLIMVDDGSLPAVKESGLDFNLWDNTQLIRNDTSIGFPAACNQIIKATGSDHICILNSDTFVAPGWLEYLHDAMDDSTGIIGPSTSYANDPQCRRDICGVRHQMTEDDIISYARKLKSMYKEPINIGSVLTGFCMLISRKALDDVGLFDEDFGLGSFEEADLCMRMIQKGYKCMWAPHAYVHHYGKRTFGGEGINWRKLWQENQKKFEKKWGS